MEYLIFTLIMELFQFHYMKNTYNVLNRLKSGSIKQYLTK